MPSGWTDPTPSTTRPSAARSGSWAASTRRSRPFARRPSSAPADAEARNAWAAALVRLGRSAEAVAELQAALEREPRLAEAHNNLGVAFWELGRRADALRALRRAAHLAKDEADPLRNLGLALLEIGRPDRAVEVLRRAAALSPGQAPALLDLAEAAFEARRPRRRRARSTGQPSRRDRHRLTPAQPGGAGCPAPRAVAGGGGRARRARRPDLHGTRPARPPRAPGRPWGASARGRVAAPSSSAPPSSSRSRRSGSWPRWWTTTSCATPSRWWPGRRSTTTPTCAIAWRTPSTSGRMGSGRRRASVRDPDAARLAPHHLRVRGAAEDPPGLVAHAPLPHRRRAALRCAGRGAAR